MAGFQGLTVIFSLRFPFFEWNASVSRLHREGRKILRELYIMDNNAEIYPINAEFMQASVEIASSDSFSQLRGADLVFACIAYLEKAYRVTLDRAFQCLSGNVDVIDLNDSRVAPNIGRSSIDPWYF